MKNTCLAVLVVAAMATPSSAVLVTTSTLIGGSTRNGDLQDISNAMQFDPPASTTPAITETGTGFSAPGATRAGNSNANAGANVTIPFWTAVRSVSNSGGNAFFGFDDGTGTPITGDGDIGFVYNNGETAGAVDLVHDAFSLGTVPLAGSIFTLSYDVATDDDDSDVISTPQLTIGGNLLSPSAIVLSGTSGTASASSTSISLSGADSQTSVVATYTLTADALGDMIELTLDNASIVDSGGLDRAAIDDIVLVGTIVAVPEPGLVSVALLSLGCVGLIGRRPKND